jgi:hypothetical protein
MKLTSILAGALRAQAAPPPTPAHYYYKTMAVCDGAEAVRRILAAAYSVDFASEQISVLVREREYWHALHEHGPNVLMRGDADDALEFRCASLLAFVRVAGIDFHGGVGLMACGPLAQALAHLGLDAVGGSALDTSGAPTAPVDDADMRTAVTAAIDSGHWVVVLHTHDETGAARARGVGRDARTFHEMPLNEHF